MDSGTDGRMMSRCRPNSTKNCRIYVLLQCKQPYFLQIFFRFFGITTAKEVRTVDTQIIQTESKTRNWTQESWLKRYNRIAMTTSGCAYPAFFGLILFALFTKTPELLLPVSLAVGIVIAIPLGYQMSMVYRLSDILDVDRDAKRYSDILRVALPTVHWIQKGWVQTEIVRTKIAMGRVKEAKEDLMSETMQKGVAQFYTAKKLELLGICAILENNREQIEACETELETLKNTRANWCGCGGNNKTIAKKIEANWNYLKNATQTKQTVVTN